MATIISRREAEKENLRLEDQLRHADRLATLGQLAADVAHELNEPLAAAVGFAQLARKCPDLPAQASRDLDKVMNASLQAREIVKRLLMFTRQMPPKKVMVNLNELIEEGLKFFESRCAKEGIKVSCSYSSSMPRTAADPSQLNQVLVNLIVNALQAMPAGGTLCIGTRVMKDRVSFTVRDTGAGMDRTILRHILTPFFTTKDVGEGTGLGLPVANGIVESHGGKIRITSHPGQGTRCTVLLPACIVNG